MARQHDKPEATRAQTTRRRKTTAKPEDKPEAAPATTSAGVAQTGSAKPARAPRKATTPTSRTRKPASAKADTTKTAAKKKPAPASKAKPAAPSPEASEKAGQSAATPPIFAPSATLAANLTRIEELSARLITAMSQRPVHDPAVEGPGPELYLNASMALWKMMSQDPARMIEAQTRYWGETLANYAALGQNLITGHRPEPDEAATTRDKRFSNPLWDTHPFFHAVKTQYLINARSLRETAAALEMPDNIGQQRAVWLTNQIIDMMAPTNFLATNPDALERALSTEGASLVQGLENLVRDLESHGGELVVSLADPDAFHVGEDIGASAGEVVARQDLFELIQFSPTTETVHKTPLVIFPPWINKYYILDLKPQNSLIRWLVDQGFTLFVVSWRNPDASHAQVGMDDYISAYLDVFESILRLTGQKQLNATGYCIAGTTLSLTLALMAQRGDDRVRSASFLTTLTDFSDQGEFTTYLQDDFVDGIEAEVTRAGYFDSRLMARTFSFLRANDLVWGPAVRYYMLGEKPPAFDLLYWNGDSTNLPARMTVEYLRGLCQQNRLATDGFEALGHSLRLSDITLPICAVACETDHIAPWKQSWRGIKQMGSEDKQFILTQSGHIAGIINPPSKDKYGHYIGPADFSGEPDDWRAKTRFEKSSWWPLWREWLVARSGPQVPARIPQPAFGPAPGEYVRVRHK